MGTFFFDILSNFNYGPNVFMLLVVFLIKNKFFRFSSFFLCILDFFKILTRFLELPKKIPQAWVLLPNFFFQSSSITIQQHIKNLGYRCFLFFLNLKNHLKFSTFSMNFTFYLRDLDLFLSIYRLFYFRLVIFWSKKSFNNFSAILKNSLG
jgi:hypothetical protein